LTRELALLLPDPLQLSTLFAATTEPRLDWIYSRNAELKSISAVICWVRGDESFVDNRYSRAHAWKFDGGLEVPASSSPHVVPEPLSDASAVDPEEAFVASLSSCHMLWFLSIAARRGFVVDEYSDEASGEMGKNDQGKIAITVVTLRPNVRFGGETQPTGEEFEAMHGQAHKECFIANSVNTDVVCHPGIG